MSIVAEYSYTYKSLQSCHKHSREMQSYGNVRDKAEGELSTAVTHSAKYATMEDSNLNYYY